MASTPRSPLGPVPDVAALSPKAFARLIDHTLLKPDAPAADVRTCCEEARAHGFAAACIHPVHVPLAASVLRGTDVSVCTVVGFPLGSNRSRTKAFEAMDAVEAGAEEIDMVLNVGALKGGETDRALADIAGVVEAVEGRPVKVILETCLLSDPEIARACALSAEAGASFVKTSTGFGGAGAKAAHVRLMRETVGDRLGVKASGGIRTAASALEMLRAGANRLGVSAGVEILEDFRRTRPGPA